MSEAAPVWYVTEEDGWFRVAQRFERLCRGYDLARVPDLLHVSAGKWLSLDATERQERIIAAVREGLSAHGARPAAESHGHGRPRGRAS